jgi:hypothetical protein
MLRVDKRKRNATTKLKAENQNRPMSPLAPVQGGRAADGCSPRRAYVRLQARGFGDVQGGAGGGVPEGRARSREELL